MGPGATQRATSARDGASNTHLACFRSTFGAVLCAPARPMASRVDSFADGALAWRHEPGVAGVGGSWAIDEGALQAERQDEVDEVEEQAHDRRRQGRCLISLLPTAGR